MHNNVLREGVVWEPVVTAGGVWFHCMRLVPAIPQPAGHCLVVALAGGRSRVAWL